TVALLTDVMGFRKIAEEGPRSRFESGDGGSGTRVDVLLDPGTPRGRGGAGTVHHVAFRNVDDPDQLAWRQRLTEHLQWPTDVRDRQYFHSIYFREPGGVLFEMATDPPGFAVDEPVDRLGSELRLPPWFETRRAEIEAALPTITSTGDQS
ncbi:MAG: VOC family protein, partial [Acidobacteriota bacterium]